MNKCSERLGRGKLDYGRNFKDTRFWRNAAVGSWLVCMAFLWTGCHVQDAIAGMELETRVNLYFTMRMDGEFDRTWKGHPVSLYSDLLDPSIRKELTKAQLYRRFNFKVLGFKVDKIERKGNGLAVVTAHIHLRFRGYELKNLKISEKWRLKSGIWYWSPKLSANPFASHPDTGTAQ